MVVDGAAHLQVIDVKNSVEQKDKSAVSFVDFCGAVVEYSNDGVLYTCLLYTSGRGTL